MEAVRIQRALISVFDKSGLAELLKKLDPQTRGIELLSTGGTAKKIAELGYAVRDVSDYTGLPESPDDLVKTLHPRVHGSLLMDPSMPAHEKYMQEQGILPTDLMVGNLYPFQTAVAKPGATFEDAKKNIDIGGPAMIRAAAKGFKRVAVLVDWKDLELITEHETPEGKVLGTKLADRFRLMQRAFAHTAEYDTAISCHLYEQHPEKVAQFYLEGQK